MNYLDALTVLGRVSTVNVDFPLPETGHMLKLKRISALKFFKLLADAPFIESFGHALVFRIWLARGFDVFHLNIDQ